MRGKWDGNEDKDKEFNTCEPELDDIRWVGIVDEMGDNDDVRPCDCHTAQA